MKKSLLAFVALLSAAGLRAEGPAPYTITTDVTYVSEYVFRGIEQQDAALQPSVTLASGDFSFGVWTSQALVRKKDQWAEGNEVDYFASYGVKIAKDYTLGFGATYYSYPSSRAALGEPRNTFEGSIGLSGPVGPLTGGVTYYRDLKLKADNFEFKLAYSMPLPVAKDAGTVDFSAVYGFDYIDDTNGGLPGKAGLDYRYYAATASVSYKLDKTFTGKVGLTYTDVAKVPGAPDANVILSVGVSAGF